MIIEKMLELLLLEKYIEYTRRGNIDSTKYRNRLQELRTEFLEPYVTDSTSKE